MDPSTTAIATGLTGQLVTLIMYVSNGMATKSWKRETPIAAALAAFFIPLGHFTLVKIFGIDPFSVAMGAPQ